MAVRGGITVVGIDKLQSALRGWTDDFNPSKAQMRILFNGVGRAVRDDVRRRITTQGDGTWQPLSKWTRARTGRRKALITERSRVVFVTKPRRVEIAYQERSNEWNLTDHHKGFSTRGFSGKRVTIPLRNPRILGIKGRAVSINKAAPSDVPARKVWTPVRKLIQIADPITARWTNRQLEKRA